MLSCYVYKDSCVRVPGIKAPSDLLSSYTPVFRSGSCAEKGPKPYMEDEHICIDDLPQHLSDISGFSSPVAFYGVSKMLLLCFDPLSFIEEEFLNVFNAGH